MTDFRDHDSSLYTSYDNPGYVSFVDLHVKANLTAGPGEVTYL